MRRDRLAALIAVVLAGAALVAGGCGGDDDSPSEEATPGTANAEAGSPEFGTNVVRVPGRSPTDVAAAAILSSYPPEEGEVPGAWVAFPREDWKKGVLAAQFVSEPVNAALLPVELDFLPTAAADLVSRVRPPGFPSGPELQALFLGEPGDDVVLAFQNQQQKMTRLATDDAVQLAADLVPYRGGWAEKFSDDILIVSSDEDARPYAQIAGAWSGFTGDTVAFVGKDEVPEPTKALLEQRQQLRLIKPNIYVVGPSSVVSDDLFDDLGAYGSVQRIPGADPVETAVEFARFRDAETGFGWGLTAAPANLSLVNLDDPGNAVAAYQLAGSGPKAPLLFTDSSEALPDAVTGFLRELQGKEASQAYVLGDRDSISSAVLAELDQLLEASAEPPNTKTAEE
jgi:hypothetical protein